MLENKEIGRVINKIEVKDDTKCWFCGRTAKQIIGVATLKGIYPISEVPHESQLQATMNGYLPLGADEPIPVCRICDFIIQDIAFNRMAIAMMTKKFDVVTKNDLRSLKVISQ